MGRPIQDAAIRACIDLHVQLDILVTDADAFGNNLPALLMLKLEHSGMDYRYAQTHGSLSDVVRRYLARGRTSCLVIVADGKALSPACLAEIKMGRHQLIDLAHLNTLDSTSAEKAESNTFHIKLQSA